MKVEELIWLLKENQDFVKAETLTRFYKISESQGFEILQQGEVFGLFSSVNAPLNWKEKQFTLFPNKLSEDSIKEFQIFIDRNFKAIERRILREWECLSCGTVITKEIKPTKCSCGSRGIILKEQKESLLPEDLDKIFTKRGQIESFHKIQPFFYDEHKMFWLYNWEEYRYKLSDEVDLLNLIQKTLGEETINSKTKSELISALQQVGRNNIPKKSPLSWIQFKKRIIDFKTNEEREASPEYFVTNPLPFDLGDSEDTPTIDRLFEEWVGKDYVLTLKQIVAYSCSSDQFMQRLFAFFGGGANGKGTFIKFMKKFIGEENFASSELKELSSNQFETSAIYKKLVCVMGEVSYDDLKNTNQIKKLSGEDDIRYCFKGKTPFTDRSIATILCQTNSLPRTPDKTLGFYRKWLITDFPNQFSEIKKDIVESIPEKEFNNFARQIVGILKELHKTQKFDKEGNFDERIQRYEERSNPVLRFVENYCEEEIGGNTELRFFTTEFNKYAKNNHLRILSVRQVSKILKEEGFDVGQRKIDGTQSSKQVILNLTLKTNETNETNDGLSQYTRVKMSRDFVGSVGSVGSSGDELNIELEKVCDECDENDENDEL